MWKKISVLIASWWSRARLPVRSNFKFGVLLIFLTTIFLYLGWEQWLLTIPQPLPQESAIATNKRDGLQRGRYYEVSIPPTGTAQYISADYRLWIPDGVPAIRGLIVKQHGCGDSASETGLKHANDLQWQALALKHQFALLGTKLPTGDRSCNSWAVIDLGSEDALLKALHTFAQNSSHPELAKVPWALWGHSGGADWAMQMSQKYPDRTLGVIAMRCGGAQITETDSLLTSEIKPAGLGVPVLWAAAEKDPYFEECVDLPQKIFSRFRNAGAIWAIAIEADTGHESADTRLLAIPYLDAILTKRLIAQETNLRPIDPTQGWLANPTTRAIAPLNQYQEDFQTAAWLPNQETAYKWQEYGDLGIGNRARSMLCKVEDRVKRLIVPNSTESCYTKILPTQKPAVPTDVLASRVGQDVFLTWNFVPDLENGLPSFRIYRNDSLVETFQGQGHNFGDAPDPPHVVLEFRDQGITANATYKVSAFNVLGESVSQPAAVVVSKQ
jgi:pimeloyl-ACP methyl ester carboxylesterase